MAGHSKWANIKHKKSRQDAKRGKIFTKLIRAITVAARVGGGDSDSNAALRLAVDKALAQNMPRDTIDRAIKRGAGGDEGANVEEIIYEGYGPGGTAFLIECLTDNRNRSVAEVRHAFSKYGGNLGTSGSVAYLFTRRGVITFPPKSDENKIMEIALESGADDVVTNDDGSIDVYTSSDQFSDVKEAIINADLEPVGDEIAMVAATQVALDVDTAGKVLRLMDMLDDLDDVQNVYTNADIPEAAFE